jgi:hypothetical protein
MEPTNTASTPDPSTSLPSAVTPRIVRRPSGFAIVAGDALHTQGLYLKVAGVLVFVFAAVGVYLFLNSASQATGGKALPLGQALVRS